VELQTVFGTAVNVTLSGEVRNVTVALRVPPVAASVDSVTRQFTQGVLPERFAAVIVELPVKGRVKEQS
jgi:hypothetical protein